MYWIMHLFYTARDITSHALGTVVSAMGPCGALGAMGSSALSILLLQMLGSTATDSVDFTQVIFAIPGLLVSLLDYP